MALSGDAQQGTLISSSGAVNSLNDQSEQISSRFWYDELGRLILSQNARQFICTDCPVAQQQIGAKAYSYTLYDEVGRIKEVGELLTTIEPTTYKNRSQIKYNDHTSYVTSTTSYRHQVTTTKYDRTDRGYTGFSATYLRNRVAYTTNQQTPSSQVQESHYSYDVHGNVKSMLQVIRGDGEELTKRIDYDYDLVSGKVNKVTYQKDNSDQFIHQYTYDGDNRIIAVATSTDDIIYTKEATYQYYAHGPLARINYGELNVETQDFAYTIQGWIKQVQGQVFAYALGYNNTDYSPIGAATQLQTPIQTGKGLYNGNIATMSSKTQVIDNNNPWVQQYTYDQLNRIKTSTTQNTSQYATAYSYDANGNILNLTRKNNAGGDIDNLTYNYENKSSGYQRNTNRLRSVDDAVATTAQTDDIEDQQEDNYRYDATGNLIYDRSEEIESIQWTVSGKVLKVIRTATSTKPNLEFTYDASGNRIAKKVIQPNGDYKTTFYVRDASGNVMAVYKTSGTANLSLEEQHIYGSSRLGIFKKDKTVRNKARALGERRYELTDHLGNVRVVLSDYKKAESIILSATDYYPFGMVARTYTSPEEYRYGFNGKELDRDEEGLGGGGSTYDYGFRIYNPALARFLSVDPLTKQFAYYGPYNFAGNKPIIAIDLDGREEVFVVFSPDISNKIELLAAEGTIEAVNKIIDLLNYGATNTFVDEWNCESDYMMRKYKEAQSKDPDLTLEFPQNNRSVKRLKDNPAYKDKMVIWGLVPKEGGGFKYKVVAVIKKNSMNETQKSFFKDLFGVSFETWQGGDNDKTKATHTEYFGPLISGLFDAIGNLLGKGFKKGDPENMKKVAENIDKIVDEDVVSAADPSTTYDPPQDNAPTTHTVQPMESDTVKFQGIHGEGEYVIKDGDTTHIRPSGSKNYFEHGQKKK